jgi:hypothetical protein
MTKNPASSGGEPHKSERQTAIRLMSSLSRDARPWLQARLADEPSTAAMQFIVMEEMFDRHSTRGGLQSCLGDAEGLHFRLRFDVAVRSMGDRMVVGDGKLAEIRDGTTLLPEVVDCMNDMSRGHKEIAAHGDTLRAIGLSRFLDDFDGDVDYFCSVTSSDAATVEQR